MLDDDLPIPAFGFNGHPGEEGFACADTFSEFVEHGGSFLGRNVEDQQLRMIEPEQADGVRKRWAVVTGAITGYEPNQLLGESWGGPMAGHMTIRFVEEGGSTRLIVTMEINPSGVLRFVAHR